MIKQSEQDFVNIDYINEIRKELLNIEDNAKNINCLTDGQWVAIRASYRLLGEYIAKNSEACDYASEKQRLIDKACKWLQENKNHPSIGCEDPCLSGYLTDKFIEQFRKVIEE